MTTSQALNYSVSLRTRDGEEPLEIIATSDNLDVATAAYEAALKEYPQHRLALHQGKTVLRERLVPGQQDLGTDFS